MDYDKEENTTQSKPKQPIMSDLVAKVKYTNTLPDNPFDLKYLKCLPVGLKRYVPYKPSTLEAHHVYDHHLELDFATKTDLVDVDKYKPTPNAKLHLVDEILLEIENDEDFKEIKKEKRRKQHARKVIWLRKTEYTSTDVDNKHQYKLDRAEAKLGFRLKQALMDGEMNVDQNTQIKMIEKSFNDAKIPITKHPSKPNVVPVEILPIYPDFDNWKNSFNQVIFDSAPIPIGKKKPATMKEMSKAIIHTVKGANNEQEVVCFLPTNETLELLNDKEVPQKDFDEKYHYKMMRKYNWNLESKVTQGFDEKYIFVEKKDGVYYNKLDTVVHLYKCRPKYGEMPSNTELIVKYRPLNALELKEQESRKSQLESLADEKPMI